MNGTAMVTVNYGTGSPEEGAAWLAYLNGIPSTALNKVSLNLAGEGLTWSTNKWVQGGVNETSQTTPSWQTAGFWATLRTQSPIAGNPDGLNFLRIGRKAPFAFHYWEIANEDYGSWETDEHGQNGDTLPMPTGTTRRAHDPTTYVSFAKQFASLASQIDPSISIGVDSQATDNQFNNWIRTVLSQSVKQKFTPNFISDHLYDQQPGQESDATLLADPSTQVSPTPANPMDWAQRATAYRNIINSAGFTAGQANGIELLATEFNSVSSSPGKQMNSIVNGVFVADSLGEMMQTQYNGAWVWDLHNNANTGDNNSTSLYGWRGFGDYGLLGTGDAGTSPDTVANIESPSYFAEQMVSKMVQAGATVVSASSDNANLDAFSVLEPNGHLELLVVNKSSAGLSVPTGGTPAMQSETFNLTGFTPNSSAQVWQYGVAQDNAQENSGNGASSLAHSTPTLGVSGSSFSFSFPSYSMTLMDLTPNPNPPSTPMPPPTVTNVVVGGSGWSNSFLSYLNTINPANVGGYSIPTGPSQLSTLPWSNINQISITFSEAVTVQQSNLQLLGANVSSYGFSKFAYNATTKTATWTLSQALGDDKLRIALSDAVVNSSKEGLSGGWTDGQSTFPSGSRGATANFVFGFNVLLGDVTQSNTVNIADVNLVQNDVGGTRGSGMYSIFVDINGSGSINMVDVSLVQNMVGLTQPANSPGNASFSSNNLTSQTSSALSSVGNLSGSSANSLFSTNTIGFDSFSQLLNPEDRLGLPI
jgi:hypothetical protein